MTRFDLNTVDVVADVATDLVQWERYAAPKAEETSEGYESAYWLSNNSSLVCRGDRTPMNYFGANKKVRISDQASATPSNNFGGLIERVAA